MSPLPTLASLLMSALVLAACPTRDTRTSAPAPTPPDPATPAPEAVAPAPAEAPWAERACITPDDTHMGFSEVPRLDGWVFTYTTDGETFAALDLQTGTLRPGKPAVAPGAPAPVPAVTLADDSLSATVCDPSGQRACITVAAPAGNILTVGAVDWARGLAVFGGQPTDGGDGVLVLYETATATQRAKVPCGKNGFVPSYVGFGEDAIEVAVTETSDSPRTFEGLRYGTKALERLPDAAPAPRFEVAVKDASGARRAVDLWPLFPRTELQATWYAAPYYGPTGSGFTGVLPSGEWLVAPTGGAFGTLAVVDPARARIVRTFALPRCGAPTPEPLACLPASTPLSNAQVVLGTFEACASEADCYAFDVARGVLTKRPQTPSLGPDGLSYWGGTIAGDPDGTWQCDEKPLSVGAPIRAAVFAHDTDHLYVVSGKPGAVATLSAVGNGPACKRERQATIGSKAHPCATVEQLGASLLVRTDDCAGAPGGAFLLDATTLKRRAAVGPEHGFTIGHGATLGVDLGGGIGAFATTLQPTIALQRLDTGAPLATVALPHPVDALFATPHGEVIAQHGRTFTRVDIDGKVLGTATLPTCP